MDGLLLLAFVTGVVGWVCLSFKVGFVLADWTRGTGFDYGFYMIGVFGTLALPFAVALEVFN